MQYIAKKRFDGQSINAVILLVANQTRADVLLVHVPCHVHSHVASTYAHCAAHGNATFTTMP